MKMLAMLRACQIAEDSFRYIWNVFADPDHRDRPRPGVGPELGTV